MLGFFFFFVILYLSCTSQHTVEELQSLGSTFIPPPFWVHNVEAQIPITICNDAAQLLIKAFGGKDCMREAVGGTRWWQVRPTPNLPAEWICSMFIFSFVRFSILKHVNNL